MKQGVGGNHVANSLCLEIACCPQEDTVLLVVSKEDIRLASVRRMGDIVPFIVMQQNGLTWSQMSVTSRTPESSLSFLLLPYCCACSFHKMPYLQILISHHTVLYCTVLYSPVILLTQQATVYTVRLLAHLYEQLSSTFLHKWKRDCCRCDLCLCNSKPVNSALP